MPCKMTNCRPIDAAPFANAMGANVTKSLNHNENSLTHASELVQEFCQARDWDQYHTAKDLAIGLVTEASELLELFRFKSETEVAAMLGSEASREAIGDELADVMFFLLRFGQKYKFDLITELKRKIEKNKIKYPAGKFRGSNKKYDEI